MINEVSYRWKRRKRTEEQACGRKTMDEKNGTFLLTKIHQKKNVMKQLEVAHVYPGFVPNSANRRLQAARNM